MEDNLKNISVKTYENVIKAIKNAQIIDIYSVENSNVIAKDLLTKLLYLGFQCRHMDDTYHQRIAASNLTSKDVAIGISYSGCSEDTIKAMKAAKKSGATTIAVTNFKDSVISLGIGDVTQPLAPAIIKALHAAVDEMGAAETFHGYAPDLGYEFLRSAIAKNDYESRGCDISADEIFV